MAATRRAFSSLTKTAEVALKHRSVMTLKGTDTKVWLAPNAFIPPSATVIGDVEIMDKVCVGYGAVIRGDRNLVKVGRSSVVGDRATLTTCATLPSGFPAIMQLEKFVMVGAGSALRSCIVQEGASVGENCVIGEGALVEAGACVGAGSVVPPGRLIPAGEHWAGNPAAYVGSADAAAMHEAREVARDLYEEHMDEFLVYNTIALKQ